MNCLNKLQRRVQATAISADTRDGHETLTLLLQRPRILCASTGHYPHLPSREPVQHTTARIPWSRDNFPGRTHGVPQAVATSRWPLLPQACPAFHYNYRTPPSSRPEWARAPESAAPLTPSCLSGWRTDARGWPTWRGGAKSKAEPQELCKQRREREISPCRLRSRALNLHIQPDVPCICGIPE